VSINVCPNFPHLLSILKKFSTVAVYKNLFSDKRNSESYNLLSGVKCFSPNVPHFVSELGEIRCAKSCT
jgi:hypothetical protein